MQQRRELPRAHARTGGGVRSKVARFPEGFTRTVVPVSVVILPLVVLAFTLLWRPWHPVLDMAMTELRVRDVGGRHTPLIGLPGRIGVFPDQGSHPGPWSFYLLAPGYRLVGGAANGLRLGSILVNMLVCVTTIAIARRIGGRPAALGLVIVMALAIRGYGLDVLGQPWNPYFPVLIWVLVLVATWGVLEGRVRLAPVVTASATVAAQTHLPYVVISVTAVVIAGYGLVQRARRSHAERAQCLKWGGIAVGVALFMWLPPIVDQIRHRPGNLTMLYREFFGTAVEAPIGLGAASIIWLRHLDLPAAALDLVTHRAAFVDRSGLESSGVGGAMGGIATLVVWMVAAAWTFRHRDLPGVRRWWRLHAMLGVIAVAELFSISRIHGKPWFYLTLWAWGTTLLVAGAIGATAVLAINRRRNVNTTSTTVTDSTDSTTAGTAASIRVDGLDRMWARLSVAGLAFAVTVGIASTVTAFTALPPEPYLSDGLAAVVPSTITALTDGEGAAVGRDGRYVVFWQDAANNGSQGYGLLDDLERAGFTVGVHPTWRVPATPQRVMPDGTYDAEVHLVTGSYIDQWRQHTDYVEVVYADDRTPSERDRFDSLHGEVIDSLHEIGRDDLVPIVDSLHEIGRDDLVPIVDTNLFGASLDPDLPRDVVDKMSEMLLIPPPIAIFIAPAGSTF